MQNRLKLFGTQAGYASYNACMVYLVADKVLAFVLAAKYLSHDINEESMSNEYTSDFRKCADFINTCTFAVYLGTLMYGLYKNDPDNRQNHEVRRLDIKEEILIYE